VLGELLSGFKGGAKESINRSELEQFLDSPRVSIIQLDEETAEFYAKIYWDIKRKGKPIPTNDLWIAASAMRHGLALFTYDEHFDNVAGLILQKEDM
jgi:tRNA(fMet)-specific endonuclease VapC